MRAFFRVKRLREIPHGWILAFAALSTLLLTPGHAVCESDCAVRVCVRRVRDRARNTHTIKEGISISGHPATRMPPAQRRSASLRSE